MAIEYKIGDAVTAAEMAAVFDSAGMKRPTSDLDRIGRMIEHADVIVTARDNGKLVGIARSITDYAFATYLSDLAVDNEYQRQGIGKKLIELTREAVGDESILLLLAARTAEGYYPHLGFVVAERAWMLHRGR